MSKSKILVTLIVVAILSASITVAVVNGINSNGGGRAYLFSVWDAVISAEDTKNVSR